jgi:transcriptional regulator with XRE-family HTH domain
MKPYAAIKNDLAKYRTELRLTQTEFAIYAQIAISTVSRVENSGHYPNKKSRQAILRYLGKFFPSVTEADIWPNPPRTNGHEPYPSEPVGANGASLLCEPPPAYITDIC